MNDYRRSAQGEGGSSIEFVDVMKVYPQRDNGSGVSAAVDGATFRVEPGEFVALLGPSGCGKTTLLKLINRIIEPTSGKITIDGMEIHQNPAVDLRRSIGYVIQQSGLFPHMRVRDNVAVVPRLLKWSKNETAQRVVELLDLVGLPASTYADRYPAQLSGGEQQRVGLARALAARPRTMLMDEPFGALDAITRQRLQDEVKRIHRQFNQTIVFVTHDIEEALRLADRIVVMRSGRVVQQGSPLDIMTNPVDAFVAELVGTNDTMRRLGLLSVRDVMNQDMQILVAESHDALSVDASLRDALSFLLERGITTASVQDEAGVGVGTVTLTSIQHAAAIDQSRIDDPIVSES